MRHAHDFVSRLEEFAPCADMASLASPPDEGPCIIVMPLLLKTKTSFREKNFRFLLRHYARLAEGIVVVEQLPSPAGSYVREEVAKEASAHYLGVEVDSPLVHKCTLVNAGSRFSFDELGARYVWQLDADIFVHPVPILRNLGLFDSNAITVIKPFVHFARLSSSDTLKLHLHSNDEIDRFSPPSPKDLTVRFEPLVGPGSMIFGRRAFTEIGGMDENYSGWGWEDIDFAERLASRFAIHTLPFRATHLHHEDDRERNDGNASRFFGHHRNHFSASEKARVLAHTSFWNTLIKICVVQIGVSTVSNAFAEMIATLPRVTDYPGLVREEHLSELNSPERANDLVDLIAESMGEASSTHCSLHCRYEDEPQLQFFGILLEMGFRFVLISDDTVVEEMLRLNSFGSIDKKETEALSALAAEKVRRRRHALKAFSSLARVARREIGDCAVEIQTSLLIGENETAISRVDDFLALKGSLRSEGTLPFQLPGGSEEAVQRLRGLRLL